MYSQYYWTSCIKWKLRKWYSSSLLQHYSVYPTGCYGQLIYRKNHDYIFWRKRNVNLSAELYHIVLMLIQFANQQLVNRMRKTWDPDRITLAVWYPPENFRNSIPLSRGQQRPTEGHIKRRRLQSKHSHHSNGMSTDSFVLDFFFQFFHQPWLQGSFFVKLLWVMTGLPCWGEVEE